MSLIHRLNLSEISTPKVENDKLYETSDLFNMTKCIYLSLKARITLNEET